MLWLKKRRGSSPEPDPGEIAPAELPIALDAGLFARHFAKLLENVEPDGGIELYLERLGAKQRVYAEVLGAAGGELGMDAIERLLGHVFTARRHLFPTLERLGGERCAGLLNGLAARGTPVARRIQDFVDAMPGPQTMDRAQMQAAAKLRRAAWDFAAEVVHFSDPVRFPLMSRWVWDRSTQSGALREFIRGNDALTEIPFDNRPEIFEGARRWMAERIAEQGIYGDVPLWIDLVLAQAYTGYLRSMTEGSLGADFARGAPAYEQLAKLLGIDAPPKGARSRVKKVVMSNG